MLQLKTRMIESDHPVGSKKTSNWKLPPIDFVYGKAIVPDKEGADIVIRSWKVHSPSKKVEPPQDFVQINKLAIKMNATDHASNKDYRKTVNIKKKIHQGNKERKIYLPDEEFTYGKKIDSITPIKSIINYDFSNRAEEVIKMEYHTYLREVERAKANKLKPKSTNHYKKLLETRKSNIDKEEKPIYKMKMFQDVSSKVKENLKVFKTYEEKKDNLDELIHKVENELKVLDHNDKK